MNAKTLPDKPSELIRVALEDQQRCIEDPDYEIEHAIWHQQQPVMPYNVATMEGEPRMKCCVCFAGGVMAKTLETDPAHAIWLALGDTDADMGWPEGTKRKLLALDRFRTGSVSDGVYTMGLREHVDRLDLHELNGEVPEYADDPEAFTLAMEDLADNLEHIGL